MRFSFAASAALLLTLTGCGITKMPMAAVNAVVPKGKTTPPPDPAALQYAVQRLADDFIGQSTTALDDYARRMDTPQAHHQALLWKIKVGSTAVSIASGPNPTAGIIDFAAQASMLHEALESLYTKSTNREALFPWLQATRNLETSAWQLAESVLRPDQLEAARAAVEKWKESTPDMGPELLVRPNEFSTVLEQAGEKSGYIKSMFNVVGGLDPTSGLEPAVKEVARSRLFAERA